MYKSPYRFIALMVALCFFGTGLNALASHSPNLDAAIACLKDAKAADDPIPKLKESIKWLNRATNQKGGKKEEAIGLVNDAIALVQSGDKDAATEKIDHAIAEIHDAAIHIGGWQ
jgi:hypothetical protein